MSLGTLVQSQARNMLTRYGTAVVLSHLTLGTGADTTGDSTTTVSTYGALDMSSSQALGHYFGDDLVKAGDAKLTLPGGLAADPVPGDTLTAAGSTWTVVSARASYVGPEIGAWELLVRR